MMKQNLKRTLAFLLTLMFTASVLPVSQAAELKDIKGHWAESYIKAGVSAGYISGYTDGTFRPNNTVTRAEFSKMINTALGITNSASVSFSDVASSQWYYSEVQRASAAGYITGYENGTFAPNKNINRQEAAAILARIVTQPESISGVSFADVSSISSWALDAVKLVNTKKYMVGNKNNRFLPAASLTRAEAAKLLYEITKNEIIASSNQTLSTPDSSYYNTIYPNNVTVTEALGSGTISFNSCKILGALTVNGGGEDSVQIRNTGVNRLIASKATGDVRIRLTGSSYVNVVSVTNGAILQESAVTGAGFQTVNLNGSSLASDTVRLVGNFDTVNISSSAVLKATEGTIREMNLQSRATLMLQSGTITTFNLLAGAKNSTIATTSSVSIATANLEGSATFTGEGKIKTAYERGGSVTYENRPDAVVGDGNSNDDGDDDDNDITEGPVATFSPKNGTDDVDLDQSIRLSFGETIYRTSGSTLSTSYLEDTAIDVREGSLNGSSVDFSAELNSSKTTITITPDDGWDEDTRYYVILSAGTIANSSGEANARQYMYFMTGSDGGSSSGTLSPSISPSNGQTYVSRSTSIRLSFGETVYRASGSSLSTSYLQSDAIEIREGSTSGTLVDYSVSMNSSRSTITLTPTNQLQTDTTYYVIINRNTLANADGDTNAKFTSRFSTGSSLSGTDIEIYPENAATDISTDTEITLTFDDPIYRYGGGTVTEQYLESYLELRRGSAYGSAVAFSASISSDRRIVTISPNETLTTNTAYYVKIPAGTLQYASSDYIPATSSYFTTTDGSMRITALSAANITSSTVDISLTSNTTGNATVTITPASGAPISQTASVTSGKQTSMTFTGLSPNTNYSVSAYVKNAAGLTSPTKTDSFQTSSLSFTLESMSVGKNSATVRATYSTVGTLVVTYKKEGSSTVYTALSNFMPIKAGYKDVVLSDLTEGTTYLVAASFTDAGGNTVTRETTFTTQTLSSETALSALTVNGSDGAYAVDLVDGVYDYTVSIAYSSSVTISPTAMAGDRATITVNNSTVKSGYVSSAISVRTGSNTIRITVKAESGEVQTYTITLNVANAS